MKEEKEMETLPATGPEFSFSATPRELNEVAWELENGQTFLYMGSDGKILVLGKPAKSDQQVLRAILIAITLVQSGQWMKPAEELLKVLEME